MEPATYIWTVLILGGVTVICASVYLAIEGHGANRATSWWAELLRCRLGLTLDDVHGTGVLDSLDALTMRLVADDARRRHEESPTLSPPGARPIESAVRAALRYTRRDPLVARFTVARLLRHMGPERLTVEDLEDAAASLAPAADWEELYASPVVTVRWGQLLREYPQLYDQLCGPNEQSPPETLAERRERTGINEEVRRRWRERCQRDDGKAAPADGNPAHD